MVKYWTLTEEGVRSAIILRSTSERDLSLEGQVLRVMTLPSLELLTTKDIASLVGFTPKEARGILLKLESQGIVERVDEEESYVPFLL